jgi:hypothetical protein
MKNWNEAVEVKFGYWPGIFYYEDLDIGGRMMIRLILEIRWYEFD